MKAVCDLVPDEERHVGDAVARPEREQDGGRAPGQRGPRDRPSLHHQQQQQHEEALGPVVDQLRDGASRRDAMAVGGEDGDVEEVEKDAGVLQTHADREEGDEGMTLAQQRAQLDGHQQRVEECECGECLHDVVLLERELVLERVRVAPPQRTAVHQPDVVGDFGGAAGRRPGAVAVGGRVAAARHQAHVPEPASDIRTVRE